ncbi:alpha/beta hydrolase [Fulvivirga sp. RKSG066]|uniref:alpha/beta hydrolase family protein n=1 Tax=Fulvivirga aurantia TaxID=2529383 RepID=UPI0012BC6FE5|nr:alpha/beta family hydrolase [Fulvivirga aurantia]MTI20585.1 alpha/beta hydrolase [Fulvivirga aurantia]
MAYSVHDITIDIDVDPGTLSGLLTIPTPLEALIVLSHGAGAGMKHSFMEELSESLANKNIGTLRFNLPYMEMGKKLPGSPKKAMHGIKKAAQQMYQQYPHTPMFLAGKSYGGRMSSTLMAEDSLHFIHGVVFYGFPLHAPGKASNTRGEHLFKVQKPLLFLQGEKDKLAQLDLIETLTSSLGDATLCKYPHADHSFKRPKKISSESLIDQLASDTANWIKRENI